MSDLHKADFYFSSHDSEPVGSSVTRRPGLDLSCGSDIPRVLPSWAWPRMTHFHFSIQPAGRGKMHDLAVAVSFPVRI